MDGVTGLPGRADLPRPTRRGLSERTPGDAADAVLAYYDGDHLAPSRIAVEQHGGPFIEDCWTELRTVAPGHPVTYTQLAERAGRPTAVRGERSAVCGTQPTCSSRVTA